MSQNAWLFSNKVPMERVKRMLVELEYKAEPTVIPSRSIQQLLQGAEAEIIRLQNLLDKKK